MYWAATGDVSHADSPPSCRISFFYAIHRVTGSTGSVHVCDPYPGTNRACHTTLPPAVALLFHPPPLTPLSHRGPDVIEYTPGTPDSPPEMPGKKTRPLTHQLPEYRYMPEKRTNVCSIEAAMDVIVGKWKPHIRWKIKGVPLLFGAIQEKCRRSPRNCSPGNQGPLKTFGWSPARSIPACPLVSSMP